MPIHHAVWKIAAQPEQLAESRLISERALEEMIIAAPRILSDQWMLIGRQEDTGFGGRIDLLAIAPDGSLVLIELKRGRTPREVVAQAIDYAVWVEGLQAKDIAGVYGRFRDGRDLAEDFRAKFGQLLDEEALNQNHQIIIVATELDGSSERIIKYLNRRGVAVNVICFQVFASGQDQLLSRAWLIDPVDTQVNASVGPAREKEPWNGEFYACFGASYSRSWDEAVRYGFISAGNGAWYINTLKLLSVGDRVWVRAPGKGFVGVGRVTGSPQPANDFRVQTPDGEKPALEILTEGTYHREHRDDAERCEWFVPIDWIETVPLDRAVNELGLFGNQNTVCRPTTPQWRQTVERLKARFPKWAG